MAALVGTSRASVWVQAARPKTLSAAAAPVLVGAGLAAAHGTFKLLPVVAAFAGAILIQIGTNLANDYYDFVRGGDTPDRVGPVTNTIGSRIECRCIIYAIVATADNYRRVKWILRHVANIDASDHGSGPALATLIEHTLPHEDRIVLVGDVQRPIRRAATSHAK